ncbi:MAG TPA: TetR/AcrR family transcriptional regulator [Polyangiaceae bacterium]|nr:TetR/AcrR family transcriptional regulator [Polyangiaceae bacterium]
MLPDPALRVPVQSRSRETRAALIRAASKEFSRHGYAEATAKSIALAANVGTGTFYHYFPDKDAVLREISRSRVSYLLQQSAAIEGAPSGDLTLEQLVGDGRSRLTRLVTLYVDYHRADRGLHRVLTERRLCDPELDSIMMASEKEAVSRFAAVLQLWGNDGDVETTAFMLFSLLEGAVHGHVLGEAMVSDDRFVRGLVEAMLRIALPAT